MVQPTTHSADLEKQADLVDKRLDRLRSLYEQYFQGIERVVPSSEREAVKRLLRELRKASFTVHNTALRFRINQLVARMNSFETYWDRVTRQIEEGTYHRDLFKAHYRAKARSKASTAEARDQKATWPTGSAGTEELSEEKISAIHQAYLQAKQRCGEPIQGLTREALATSLRRQLPAIIKQYRCGSVEFKVVIKDGKAIIRAVPKS